MNDQIDGWTLTYDDDACSVTAAKSGYVVTTTGAMGDNITRDLLRERVIARAVEIDSHIRAGDLPEVYDGTKLGRG